MCGRQLEKIFAVLFLAAAVAHTHGQGKNLDFTRTLWQLFRALPGEPEKSDVKSTSVFSRSASAPNYLFDIKHTIS